MLIYVYLKDEVTSHPNFENGNGNSSNYHKVAGLRVNQDDGRWHFVRHETTEPIPQVVANLVDGASLREWIPIRQINRKTGIYRHESAEAEIKFDKFNGEDCLEVNIVAKKMEDLVELWQRFMIGSILPENNYNGRQWNRFRYLLHKHLKRIRSRR